MRIKGDIMSIMNGLKSFFSKNEKNNQELKLKELKPVRTERGQIGMRTEQTINAEHRQDVEEALVRTHRDYLARKINLSTLLDTLNNLKEKMQEDEVLAKSKRLPSTLYGIFTASGEPKVQRIVAEIVYSQAIQGNSDAIRIAKMLNQLANDHVTKDLLNTASNRVVEF